MQVRLFKLFFMLFLMWHWFACIYWTVCEKFDRFTGEDGGWAPPLTIKDEPFYVKYMPRHVTPCHSSLSNAILRCTRLLERPHACTHACTATEVQGDRAYAC